MRLPSLFAALVMAGAGTAAAFNPPLDTLDQVTLRIDDFPDRSDDERVALRQVPAEQPLSFTVTLTNESAAAVEGSLTVWLNDDWQVRGEATVPLRAGAGASVTVPCTAVAKPTVLNALYPVHAKFTFGPGQHRAELHPVAIFEARKAAPPSSAPPPREAASSEGVLRLDSDADRQVFFAQRGKVTGLGVNFAGSDAASGTTVQRDQVVRGGVRRAAFGVHPPYRGGPGSTWSDFALALPAGKPATLRFHTSLRDHTAAEPPSDGTEFKVIAVDASGGERVLFERFSAAKTWQPASVDLGPFAGQRITLRLWTGPGPKNDTTCDHCYWGDPAIVIGSVPAPPTGQQWEARETEAVARAIRAAHGEQPATPGSFRLEVNGQPFGAAAVPGEQGLTDGALAFADGNRALVCRGFDCDIDGTPVGGTGNGRPVLGVELGEEDGTWSVRHRLNVTDREGRSRPLVARARLRADGGALRIAWDMPGASRDRAGTPRYTRLGLGPASEPVWRVYAGFGNVIEKPGAFRLTAGGFTLSTRHAGADYPNGLSLLQACDVFPDALAWEPASRRFALESAHDATFLFVPSAKGAFDAARAYREVCGFAKGPGVDALLGRMCLDQWGGACDEAARGIAEAARYGVNRAVFVKHVWQRWGYDYRLPEIHPPAGGLEPFLALRAAAEKAGMLFCPHDNYIDFYPDAAGFSYDHIVFAENGQPVRAWYNQGRRAQSYRWLPHAFRPWLEPNMREMRDTFRPDSLFIDVFTAIAPFDAFDRAGNFHPRTRTVREWRAAFDTSREILGRGSPMISEAGTDALIGSVDAAQADHFPARRWLAEFANAERTPWHDMVSHGKMILFAGGLGPRYSALGWDDHGGTPGHGYGSDDYLSNTVLGGRNPMCDGPFSRRAVMTGWLLNEVCDRLGRDSLETHRFGATIQQQHTTFRGGGKVWTNRAADAPWTLPGGRVLPEHGFYAEAPGVQAGVVLIDGQRAGFSQDSGSFFADARPPHHALARARVASSVKEAKYLGDGCFEVVYAWQVFEPVPPGHVPFVHLCHERAGGGERIAFQAGMPFDLALLGKPGSFEVRTRVVVPPDQAAGDYQLRYGLYRPAAGARLAIDGCCDAGARIRGGTLKVGKNGATFTGGSFVAEDTRAEDLAAGLNVAGKLLDFGPLATDGAFRLQHADPAAWHLVPLPGSKPFRAVLRLPQLGTPGAKVRAVETVDPFPGAAREVRWEQQGDSLRLDCDGRAFGYRIDLAAAAGGG